MKKTGKSALIILIVAIVLVSIRFIFGGPEDDRICDGGQRVPHGNPSAPIPTSGCTLSANPHTMSKINILADRENNGQIPSKYTCDGDGEFPTLMLSNVPANAQSLALIVDDPDAPVGTFDHYIIANIPNLGTEFEINTGIESQSTLGKNGRGDTNRGGPCPPNGEHRYYFKVYALDAKLHLKKGFRKSELIAAMQGHTVGTGEIIGLYTRKTK